MTRPTMPKAERAAFIRETKGIEIPFLPIEEGSNVGAGEDQRSKYRSLTTRQYRAFMDTYRGEGSEDSKIIFGFRVVGHLLSQVPVAYAEHLRGPGEYSNMRELEATMQNAFASAVASIARLDRDRAQRYHTWLGLRDGSDPLGTTTAYRFVRWRDQPLRFEPKLENLDMVDEEVAYLDRSDDHTVAPERGCPALKFVLPTLWSVNIAGCISDQNYFAHDIRTLSAQGQNTTTRRNVQ